MIAAAFNQSHFVQMQMPFEDFLQAAALLGNADTFAAVPFDDKYIHITHNVWMDGEFIVIHHGKHSIQMHKGTLFWNINGQYFFEVALLRQHLLGKFLDSVFVRALRNPDCDYFLI